MNDARGYVAVLRNRNFLLLWLAQIASLLAQNSSLFVTIVLVQKATDSTTQTAGIIAAYNIPAIFLSAFGGVLVDRVSKKNILTITNALRIAFQLLMTLLAGWALSGQINTALFVGSIYVLICVSSVVGQFFAPAEGAMIPLLVGHEALLAANSLFTLTVVGTQVAAIIVVFPIAVKTLGVVNTLLLLGILYLLATLLVARLPLDRVTRRATTDARSALHRTWQEIQEGWGFALKQPVIMLAILQIALVASLVYVVGTIAPGYTERVLGLAPEDSIFVFAPAGLGILLASAIVVRFGSRWRRYLPPIVGTVIMGLAFISLGVIGSFSGGPHEPLFRIYPDLTLTVTSAVSITSIFAGAALALILIPAQTAVQEEASDEIRGRVLTVQFTLSNALGVIPLLLIGGFSDLYGIPQTVLGVGVLLLVISIANYTYARSLRRHKRRKIVAQPLPLPGADPITIREAEERQNGNGETRSSVSTSANPNETR